MKSDRVTISMPAATLKGIDSAAKALGMNRSQFIANVLTDHLAEGDAIVKALADGVIRDAFMTAFTRPGVLKALTSEMGQDLTDAQRQKVLKFMKAGDKVVSR